jgi:hypothetical protein
MPVNVVKKNMNRRGKVVLFMSIRLTGDSKIRVKIERRGCAAPWIIFQRKGDRHQISVLT